MEIFSRWRSFREAVANGTNKNHEIASRIGKLPNAISPYIKNLISLEILEKRNPVEEKSAKKMIFVLADKMFYFWYRFIPRCRYQIAMGLVEEAFEKKIRPYMSEYFGIIFEEICKQYILRQTTGQKIHEIYDDYGKWWGDESKEKMPGGD